MSVEGAAVVDGDKEVEMTDFTAAKSKRDSLLEIRIENGTSETKDKK